MVATSELVQFDCDLCGACCRTFPIFATIDDARREPAIFSEARRVDPSLAGAGLDFQLYPMPFHDSCCFLEHDDCCRIYSTRPHVCREFEAGSPQCQEARTRHGITPLLAVENPSQISPSTS